MSFGESDPAWTIRVLEFTSDGGLRGLRRARSSRQKRSGKELQTRVDLSTGAVESSVQLRAMLTPWTGERCYGPVGLSSVEGSEAPWRKLGGIITSPCSGS